MDQQSQLIDICKEIGLGNQSRATHIERELADIETQKAKLQQELHAANLAHDRLSRFIPMRWGNLQCPSCWVDHEMRASLRPIGGGTGKIDNFRCNTCDKTFALTF